MSAVSRKGDRVLSQYGYGGSLSEPLNVQVEECNSSNVYANGKLVVCEGNIVQPHPDPILGTDTSLLNIVSSKVFINGKGIGRVGDNYLTRGAIDTNNVIQEGSPNVFAG